MNKSIEDYPYYGPINTNQNLDGLSTKMSIMCDINSMARDFAREIDEAALSRTLEILETQYGYVKAERLQDLKAENQNLRDLVKAAWRCIHMGIGCSDCRLIAGGCTLQTAMRELGVEV